MTVDKSAEGQPVSPAASSPQCKLGKKLLSLCFSPQMEVLNVDVFVRSRLSLTPEKKAFLGSHLLDRDVLDGETENDRPNHTQGHLHIAVHNFLKLGGSDSAIILPSLDCLLLFHSRKCTDLVRRSKKPSRFIRFHCIY